MNSARAFAPGNISCIFVIKKNKNPEKSGSLGVGFTTNKGVVVTAKKRNNKKNQNIIYFNDKKIRFPTIDSVIKKLTNQKAEIKIKSELPLCSGFGVSGASALATAYALNKLFNLKRTKRELAMVAHIAEVENNTGLGDVVNQYFGGFLAKYKPSYMFKVKKIKISNKPVYYKYFSKFETKKIISNRTLEYKINKAGIKALVRIKKMDRNRLDALIKISKEFAMESGLLKDYRIINLIKNIEKNNGNASMIMLGNAVFSDKVFPASRKLIIKDKGAHLI